MSRHAGIGASLGASPRATLRRPLIMGILNVTPDSFSDGGEHEQLDRAVAVAAGMVAAGADIIDVGGESTRPGSERVEPAEEWRRVEPVIRELVALGMRVSIDTMNASTAAGAVALGAAMINDVSGGTRDASMPRVVAESALPFVAMHSRGAAGTPAVYDNVVIDVRAHLELTVESLMAAGVARERIILDPGIGFSKTADDNWALLGGLGELATLGFPLLVGASRKGFLAPLLQTGAPMAARDAPTAIISAISADAGAWGVRVHDVAATRIALDVWSRVRGATSADSMGVPA